MIRYENRFGTVSISNFFFTKLIGHAVSSCYGVAGMVAKGPQRLRQLFSKKDNEDKGIRVKGDFNAIAVDIYIVVTYGVNINAIAKSIVSKVKYVVEDSTGITVEKVTVHIDGMKSE